MLMWPTIPDCHVVPDMAKIVDTHAILDHGIVDRAAIYRGVGADLDVVSDTYPPELRHLDPPLRRHSVTETIGADHDARMEDAAQAEYHVAHQDNVGD